MEKGDVSPNDAPYGGLEVYQMDWLGPILFYWKWEKTKNILEGVNALSHQYLGGEIIMCYLLMPLVVALTPIEGELPEPFFGGENGKNLCIFFGEHQHIISSTHGWRKDVT